MGRPKGRDPKVSLGNILETVSIVFGVRVKFSSTCVGEEAEKKAKKLKAGDFLLMEILRYHSE